MAKKIEISSCAKCPYLRFDELCGITRQGVNEYVDTFCINPNCPLPDYGEGELRDCIQQIYDLAGGDEMKRISPLELKACPMCGPGGSVVECYQDDYGKWRVACGACGLHSGIRVDNDRELIEKHWNQRPREIDGHPATYPGNEPEEGKSWSRK